MASAHTAYHRFRYEAELADKQAGNKPGGLGGGLGRGLGATGGVRSGIVEEDAAAERGQVPMGGAITCAIGITLTTDCVRTTVQRRPKKAMARYPSPHCQASTRHQQQHPLLLLLPRL
jgi:hypothetical protein